MSEFVYSVDDVFMLAEEDVYDKGVVGGSNSWSERVDVKGESLDDVLSMLLKKLYLGKDEVGVIVMPDESRIDIAFMGDEYNAVASKEEIEKWKKGNLSLWYYTVSCYVEKRKKDSSVPEEEMEKFAEENGFDLA